jgi:hypothetical protein
VCQASALKLLQERKAAACRRERLSAVMCSNTAAAHLQASTTDDSLKRQGSGANFVAIAGEVPVCRIKPPMNSSEKPNPYTCQHRQYS